MYRCFEEPVRCPGGEPGTCAVGRDRREGNTVTLKTKGDNVWPWGPFPKKNATRISCKKEAYGFWGF